MLHHFTGCVLSSERGQRTVCLLDVALIPKTVALGSQDYRQAYMDILGRDSARHMRRTENSQQKFISVQGLSVDASSTLAEVTPLAASSTPLHAPDAMWRK
ncbi:hypothetical protein N7G274_010688 [Stereocaulon virgatum]|uniref:Uncharacterized protein n=1 Tax=Stereocaulon virgatum TaxID=373712 RepID=A0ABR3ZT37_9LECA